MCYRKPISTVCNFQKAVGITKEEEADTALVSRNHYCRHEYAQKRVMSQADTASFASDVAFFEFLASAPSVFRDLTPDHLEVNHVAKFPRLPSQTPPM